MGWLLPLIFAVLGLALLALELWAARLNGFLLVIASFSEYHVRSDLRMFGVPFVYAALAFKRGHWIDYTGFLTLPALVGNVAVAFLLPQLILAGLWRISRLRP